MATDNVDLPDLSSETTPGRSSPGRSGTNADVPVAITRMS